MTDPTTVYPIEITDEHERLRAYYRVLVARCNQYDRLRRDNWSTNGTSFWNGKYNAVESVRDDLAALFPFVVEVQS